MYRATQDVLSVRFNHDDACFTCCMEGGVRIYNIEPLSEIAHIDASDIGSVGICAMLHRTNFIAIIGGGSRPKYAENTVLIWDDNKKSFVLEFTFGSKVLNVYLKRDRMFVVVRAQIHVFSFPHQPTKLSTVDTRINPKGLCAVSPLSSSEHNLLAFPGQKMGTVQILDVALSERGLSNAPGILAAHQSELGCLALNQQATRVATASEKGTLIRIFDTIKKVQLLELRRGYDPATFYCINFSRDSDYLCASSDKGTVHIFALKDTHLNRKSTFSNMGFLSPYVESQWALTNFSVTAECACICAFGSKGIIYAVCVDGTFHKFAFNQEGNCTREAFDVFLDLCDDSDF